MAGRSRPVAPHLAADDKNLSKLMGPTREELDDAALNAQLSGTGKDHQVDKVLHRITALKEERAKRRADAEGLERIWGSQTQEGAPYPSASMGQPGKASVTVAAPPTLAKAPTSAMVQDQALPLLRVPRVRCIKLDVKDLAPGTLCYYAGLGDVANVSYLCDQARRCEDRFLVNTPDQRGRTALHHVAFEGTVDVADALLQAGADVLQRDADERNPLHIAASRGQEAVARLMLGTCVYRLRANALRRFRSARIVGQPMNVEGHDATLLEQQAACAALTEYLRGLEDLRYNLLMAEDKFGHTSLYYSLRDSYRGCLPMLQLILSSLFEFGGRSRTDEVMRDRRFEAQPGVTLVKMLMDMLLPHQRETVRNGHVKRSMAIHEELVNGKDLAGFTPLHYAAAEGNYRAVHALMAMGADPSAPAMVPTKSMGADGRDLESVRGATPFYVARDSTTRHALASYPARDEATLEAQARSIATLIDGNCESVNREYGIMARTPLHAAIFSAIEADANSVIGAPPVVQELLAQHPECNPLVPDASGWTPIHYACAFGRDEELDMILGQAKRLHPKLGDAENKENLARQQFAGPTYTRGHDARKKGASYHGCFAVPQHRPKAETGRLDLIRPEHRPPDPSKARVQRRARSAGFGGGSVLSRDHHAGMFTPPTASSSSTARPDGYRKGVEPHALGALMGRTPTHVAAQAAGEDEVAVDLRDNGHLRCLTKLLEVGLLELEAEDERGHTPLLAACAAGATTAVQWLLDRGADCNKVDRVKQNALHIAISRGHRRVVRLLVHHDADVSKLKNGQDWKARLPCEMVRTNWVRCPLGGADDPLEDLATVWEAARSGDINELHVALRSGVDINSLSPGGWTATMYAAECGNAAILRHLIQLKGWCDPPPVARNQDPLDSMDRCWKRPRVRPPRGRGPLHLAAEAGHAEICLQLLRHGCADLEAVAHDGSTPFLCACRAGHAEVVEELLAMGAKVDVDQKENWCRLFVCGMRAALPPSRGLAECEASLLSACHVGFKQVLQELELILDKNAMVNVDEKEIRKIVEEGGGPFVVMARGTSERHAECIRLLTSWLIRQDHISGGMNAIDLLEKSVAELASFGSTANGRHGSREGPAKTRAHAAVVRALARVHRDAVGGGKMERQHRGGGYYSH